MVANPNKKPGNIGNLKPGQGRPKGVKNKVTRQLKAMILGALDDAGGQAYLKTQATKNPRAFLALLGRVVPQEVKADLRTKSTVVVVERTYGETINVPPNAKTKDAARLQ